MVRHHKKTRKTRRRSMRGGMFPFTNFDGSPWSAPATVATAAAPAAAVVSKPFEAAIGLSPGGTTAAGAPILGPSANTGSLGPIAAASNSAAGTGLLGGRRRRRTRKSRRRH